MPEILPADVLEKMHAPPKSDYPLIEAKQLADADGIILGFPTRSVAPVGGRGVAFVSARVRHGARAAGRQARPACVRDCVPCMARAGRMDAGVGTHAAAARPVFHMVAGLA